MELVLVHITDIHLENDTDYNILIKRIKRCIKIKKILFRS